MVSSEIQYKMASLEDLPLLEDIGDRLFDYPVKRTRAIEFLKDPRHHLALGLYEGNLVAMASGFHYVHPDKDPVLFINEVSVLEEYQNQGIGRKIVKFLCDFGKRLDLLEAWVATETCNTAARKAYIAAEGKEEKECAVVITFDLSK